MLWPSDLSSCSKDASRWCTASCIEALAASAAAKTALCVSSGTYTAHAGEQLANSARLATLFLRTASTHQNQSVCMLQHAHIGAIIAVVSTWIGTF
jgi:hypothetical protein